MFKLLTLCLILISNTDFSGIFFKIFFWMTLRNKAPLLWIYWSNVFIPVIHSFFRSCYSLIISFQSFIYYLYYSDVDHCPLKHWLTSDASFQNIVWLTQMCILQVFKSTFESKQFHFFFQSKGFNVSLNN